MSQRLPSSRRFGLLFVAVFLAIGLYPLFSEKPVRYWALAVSALFLILALFIPRTLTPLNRLWMRFGSVLHRVVNPLVTAVLFYAVVTPAGLLMRAFGKDPMHRKFDTERESYWIKREDADPSSNSMRNQF